MKHTVIKTAVLTLLLLLSCLVSAAPSHAQVNPPTDQIDAFVQERMRQLGIPGTALAIVQGGDIVHLAGYGVADDAGTPMTPQTPFLLASLSKSITAVAIMQLVEAEQISLDDPIQTYLPWFMPESTITIRQLLHQTSGLDEGQGYDRNLDPDGTDALEQSIRVLATTDLNRPPGTQFEYSNSNYDILGLLVETVTNQPYCSYIETQIFEPLTMQNASASLNSAQAGGLSQPFYPFFGRPTNVTSVLPYSRATQPSTGLFGSAADMATYLLFHLENGRSPNNQLLTSTSLTTLHTPDASINEDGLGYAMGWAAWSFDDAAKAGESPPLTLSHGGNWLGYNHLMLLIPEENFGLVLLLNSNDPTRSSAYSNIAFDATLLALGHEMQNYPPTENWLSRNLRPLSVIILLGLLITAIFALRLLRNRQWGRQISFAFIGMTFFDLVLVSYLLFIRLPNNNSSIQQVIRFEPDLGLMLLLILLITLGWGTIRSLWALRRWQTSAAHSG